MADKRVASGGAMFNTKRPSVSKETQDLLKLMMQESKLTNFQQRQLSANMKDGKSLPVTCNPTSSRINRISPVKKQVQPKVMNARHLTSSKRKKETIEQISESNKDDNYRPKPGKVISEKDKIKLQHKMAYGNDIAEMLIQEKLKPASQNNDVEEPYDEFNDVLQQIEERKEFLEDMEKLGQGKNYRSIIQTEISQRIKQLEIIDKKRTQELEAALKEQQKISSAS